MKYSKHVLALLVILLFSHCTKELPFPDAEDNPLIVVNSLFSPASNLEVHVSRSCHIQATNCSNTFIADAEVVLLDNEGSVLTTLEHKAKGIYSPLDFKVSHNTQYQIKVRSKSQDLADVVSKSIIPNEVKASLIGVEEATIDTYRMWVFDIEIEDDPTEENYYLIQGTYEKPGGEHREWENQWNSAFSPHFKHRTDDPNAENKIIGGGVIDLVTPALRYVFLTDKNFNGEKYKIRVGVDDDDLYQFGNSKVDANITVKSVSKEMYDYTKSITAYSLRIGDPFSEPEQIFTNVDNGLGIFAGYSQKDLTVELPFSEYAIPNDVQVINDGCTSPCIVKFSTDGGPLLSYFWDFGDGQTSSEASPEHSYAEPGVYEVECLVQYDAGSSSSWGFQVTIN